VLCGGGATPTACVDRVHVATTSTIPPIAWLGGQLMKKTLDCPCGLRITAEDEDELVEQANAHLLENHPGHEYTRDQILFMAY
jgi:hypothetical protein